MNNIITLISNFRQMFKAFQSSFNPVHPFIIVISCFYLSLSLSDLTEMIVQISTQSFETPPTDTVWWNVSPALWLRQKELVNERRKCIK